MDLFDGFNLGFDTMFGSVWLLAILTVLVMIAAMFTGRSYLWVLTAWMFLWLFDFQYPDGWFSWVMWFWWLAIILVTLWALFTSFSSRRRASGVGALIGMVITTILVFFALDLLNGDLFDDDRPVVVTTDAPDADVDVDESPDVDPTDDPDVTDDPSASPSDEPTDEPTDEPSDGSTSGDGDSVREERKYYGAPATIPGGTCPGILGWDTLVECVEDNDLDWYVAGVNDRAGQTGFDWSDIKTWADARTPEGNLPESRYVQVFGATLSDEQAIARGRNMTDENLRVVRQSNCFANTEGIEGGRMKNFDYCPKPERQARVSLMPLQLNDDGEVTGVLDTDSGVFIDCLNVWWSND